MTKISRGGKSLVPIKPKLPKAQTELLISDIRSFIEQSRYRVSRAVNAELSMLYWRIGQRIRKNVLK